MTLTAAPEQAAVILIDLKKPRIRIYKNTLHALGDPSHIDLFINPETHTIGIGCGSLEDKLSHRISRKQMQEKPCIELYSRSLITALKKMFPEWSENYNYRIRGAIIPEKKIARFRMEDAVPVLKGKEMPDGQ